MLVFCQWFSFLGGVFFLLLFSASLVAQVVKHLPAMWETWVRSLAQEDPLQQEMAHTPVLLLGKIPWMEEPDRLQSMGSQNRTQLSSFTLMWLTKHSVWLVNLEVSISRMQFCVLWLCSSHRAPQNCSHGVSEDNVRCADLRLLHLLHGNLF